MIYPFLPFLPFFFPFFDGSSTSIAVGSSASSKSVGNSDVGSTPPFFPFPDFFSFFFAPLPSSLPSSLPFFFGSGSGSFFFLSFFFFLGSSSSPNQPVQCSRGQGVLACVRC